MFYIAFFSGDGPVMVPFKCRKFLNRLPQLKPPEKVALIVVSAISILISLCSNDYFSLIARALGSSVADFQSVGTTEFLFDIRDDTHSGLFVRLDGDSHKTLLGLFH